GMFSAQSSFFFGITNRIGNRKMTWNSHHPLVIVKSERKLSYIEWHSLSILSFISKSTEREKPALGLSFSN
ncbi:hypothetical protein Q8G48_28510, partial [Klebsiella pneumoniae]|uniref:hypothetical protein n=1 Tax=Klebsiella pneumoniae TaxID=573 RepID=UPI0030135903